MKHSNHVHVFNRSHEVAETWVRELCASMNWLTLDDAYNLLRAVLQSLRDWITIDEAAQFSAQLPLVLRGTFYEGWNPGSSSKLERSREAFLMSVQTRIGPYLKFDLEPAIQAVIQVIGNHVSDGEMQDVFSEMPGSVRDLLANPARKVETASPPTSPP